jgi:hypothetical protein
MRKGSKKQPSIGDEILEMALHGYQVSLEAIEEKIAHIRKSIERPGAIGFAVEEFSTDKPKRKSMSASGRKKIAAAQRLRWKKAKAAEKKLKTNRAGRPKLSAAERSELSGGQAT